MAYTKQTADENKAMFEAAKLELERLGYDPDDDNGSHFCNRILYNLKLQFSDIQPSRLQHQINRVIMQKRGEAWCNRPGAPIGNTNAARKDGLPRQLLNVRVEQSTLEWLQIQANKTTGGNIGRWLDKLAE